MTASSELKLQLEEACQNLWWSSEADYPVEVVWPSASAFTDQEQNPTHDALVRRIIRGDAKDTPVDTEALVTREIESFFARSLTPKAWHTQADKAQLAQLQQLKTLLTQSLQQLQVYRYGEVEVKVYILGYTTTGQLAGVKTCLVET